MLGCPTCTSILKVAGIAARKMGCARGSFQDLFEDLEISAVPNDPGSQDIEDAVQAVWLLICLFGVR